MSAPKTPTHDWKVKGLKTHLGVVQGGELLGKQWQPSDIAEALYEAGFKDAQVLSDALKVVLGESQGYDRAYNDNLGPDGKTVTSRDVGIMQINIPASEIGTEAETALYDVPTNVAAGFKLWSKRGFEPWVSYVENVVYRDTYLKRANRGMANYFARLDLAHLPTDTLGAGGVSYVHVLTNPVTDFEYRVTDQHNSITAALRVVMQVKNSTSLAVAKTQGSKATVILQQAVSIPKS